MTHSIKQPKDVNPWQGNCSIVAAATCFNRSIGEVTAMAQTEFNKRANWKGSLTVSEISRLLVMLGSKGELLYYKKGMKQGSSFNCARGDRMNKETITLQKFCSKYAKLDVTYYIIVTGHAVALRNGVVIDQGKALTFDKHPSRNKHVWFAANINNL